MSFSYSCSFCHKQFFKEKRLHYNSVHCSQRCYTDHVRSNRPTLQCTQCGYSFTVPPSKIKVGVKFCSRHCYDDHHSASRKAKQKAKNRSVVFEAPLSAEFYVEKLCPTCQRRFWVRRSISHRYHNCSAQCTRSTTKYVSCLRCGKVFRAEPRLNRKYCSEPCRRPPVILECALCQGSFRVCPWERYHRKFCSTSCYRRFEGETSIERSVRIYLESAPSHPFIQEAKIGRYSIDFLLFLDRVALEVDGDYWHRDYSRDERKDTFLAAHGWRVVRIPEKAIKSGVLISLIVSNAIAPQALLAPSPVL